MNCDSCKKATDKQSAFPVKKVKDGQEQWDYYCQPCWFKAQRNKAEEAKQVQR